MAWYVVQAAWFSELKVLPTGEARAFLLLDLLGKSQKLGFNLAEIAR